MIGGTKRNVKTEKRTKTGKYRKTKKKRGDAKGGGNAALEPGEVVWDEQTGMLKDDLSERNDSKSMSPSTAGLTKKQRKKNALAKTPEAIAARRRKLWILMAKKELGKVQRAKANNHKEIISGCKRISTLCMKTFRQKAMQSQKNMKETVWRAKRLTREMQGYWKRYDRVERETRRRMEKEAEEQRKVKRFDAFTILNKFETNEKCIYKQWTNIYSNRWTLSWSKQSDSNENWIF